MEWYLIKHRNWWYHEMASLWSVL